MTCPGNGIYVVQGEMTIILTAMRRGARWSSHTHQDEDQDALMRSFTHLKDTLNQIDDLFELDPNTFLGPFLEVIRSEETTGPVTSLALSSVNKFLSYGLIDRSGKSVAATVENIADAVTHARFVGTDQASDGVVLMKILQVLRTLMLSPEGAMLTNESICEIMLSCFRICFESRLSELLRRTSEHCLKDMVQLLFTRLPQFSEDFRVPVNLKKIKMRPGNMDPSRAKRKHHRQSAKNRPSKTSAKHRDASPHSPQDKPSLHLQDTAVSCSEVVNPSEKLIQSQAAPLATTPLTSAGNIVDMQGAIHQETSVSNEDLRDVASPVLSERHIGSLEDVSENASISEQLPLLAEGLDQQQPQQQSILPGGENLNLSACVVINVEPESLDGADSPSLLSSKTCSVEDISISSHQEEVKSPLVSEIKDSVTSEIVTDQLTNITASNNSNINNVETEEEARPIQDPAPADEEDGNTTNQDYVNPRGVRFMANDAGNDGSQPLVPYGLVCVRELFRFLISLCNPLDKQNNETMVHLGLTLLTVALEIGADSVGKFNSLLSLVKDELCRNLFSLLSSERLSIFAADLQVCFLLFESLRTHLKFQQETYLTKLIDIVISDSPKITYEQKEIALESVVQLWRIPGLVTELYLNYDCDLYCPNLFEDLTKLLSKNAFPVSGLYNTHLLSLDALLTIIDSIEAHCHSRILSERQEDGALTKAGTLLEESGVHAGAPKRARQKVSESIPTHEQLMALKRKKKLLSTGTEQFNAKPKKGIQFLQDHHLLSTPLDPVEVVHFLRENPRLDKKMIGEYISNRSNLQVLDCFVRSFDFTDMRIDEALRLYLETFRLPGESPLISLIMEHFAEHWHKCNGEPFANADAAFTLAYAVIMLNVDQHNYNVKRQNNPMTVEEFKRNLKNVNGGKDFDHEMLDDIYCAIKNEEIVMPAEQTGLVRENYLWKVLLRRGASKDGVFIHAPNGLFDHDLFSLIWGPTVAALSFVFDKSNDATIYQKAISGFRKCAMISAHYGMSNDFDNLVISLCKFTTLLNSAETPDNLTISFGSNPKAQLAAKTVFNLAHRHGDILREGWKNVLDCVLQLYRCKLLPKALVEAEDFIEPSGKICLMREETPSQKTETGLLSSLYSYIALASEPSNQKVPSIEDQEHIRQAHVCVRDCHLEQLITESKFLRLDSLQELVKALIFASHGPDGHLGVGMAYDEDVAVFFLELLLKVVIQNRDRVNTIWQSVRDHIYSLMMGAAACDHHLLLERSVVGLLRLAIRLMRREEMSPVVLQSLRMLLLLKSATLFRVSRQISYGLYELLKTSAANIHSDTDWSIIFTLLECVGAGAHPPRIVGDNRDNSKPASEQQTAKSDGEVAHDEDSGIGSIERGYTSDSELTKNYNQHHSTAASRPTSPELSPNSGGGWILVGREGEIQPLQIRPLPVNQFSIVHERELLVHDPYSLVKCCESLAFLVRDVAHITPYNFENCIHCIRTFVEASLNLTEKNAPKKSSKDGKSRKKKELRKREDSYKTRSSQHSSNPYDADESDSEELPGGYHQVSIQLLDLMHTLHTRTAQIFRWWAEENGDTDFTSLWAQGWCPLLQGIARLCCDSRKQVRMSAITYLQRALLVHDLQTLTAPEWESCFNKVLFPLLAKLLEPINPQDIMGLEETRMRAATVLSKVFLHHLTPLQSLPTFTALWLTILDFMDKYMHADKSDLLYEAIPESLKNMLLVMDSAGVFTTPDGYSQLWTVTWDRINVFLPTLKEELFKSHPSVEAQSRVGGRSEEQAELSTPPETVTSPQPEPVASSIILQPPSPPVVTSRNISTPIFSRMGHQMMSTPIGMSQPVPSPPLPEPANLQLAAERRPASTHPQVYLQTTSSVSPVPFYSAYNIQDNCNTGSGTETSTSPPVTRVIPPHYFYQDVQQTGQVFPVPVQPPSSSVFLLDSGTNMPTLPILSPPAESEQSNVP
ncbi:Golgi-specific brefeldin A-resistance guanine nucleotide exchange factor 1 [Anabrus simplex]|uniref:Golgi-specific brefeldin A-resistance guanine nucleotide exchange factor 1 n=1 Tax=Anabrus simplex TaxID=316456 RepID=UPI0035A2A4B3